MFSGRSLPHPLLFRWKSWAVSALGCRAGRAWWTQRTFREVFEFFALFSPRWGEGVAWGAEMCWDGEYTRLTWLEQGFFKAEWVGSKVEKASWDCFLIEQTLLCVPCARCWPRCLWRISEHMRQRSIFLMPSLVELASYLLTDVFNAVCFSGFQ